VPGITGPVDLNESLINILEDDDVSAEQVAREIQAALGTAETATATPDNPAGVQVGTQIAETRAGVRELLARPVQEPLPGWDYRQLAKALLDELAERSAASGTAI
jgi:hypothetical protein